MRPEPDGVDDNSYDDINIFSMMKNYLLQLSFTAGTQTQAG